jgi:hypothetical protein
VTRRRQIYDFGFDPSQGGHHFELSDEGESVTLVEWFAWNGSDRGEEEPLLPAPEPKVHLDRYRWSRIAAAVADEFNVRLRRAGLRPATWKTRTLLAPHFGKELALLMWAVEDVDPSLIPNVIANWRGFAPEERWWLYTTINATAGHPDHGKDRGWRKAIRIALAENPTEGTPSSALRELAPLLEAQERRSRRERRRPEQPRLPLGES